jgi:hypothetical protein
MAEEWFWKHKGQMLGPLDTETLADLVRKRRVFDRDEVRFAESAQWITGAELKQLFTETPHVSSVDAAAALLAHVRRPDGGDESPVAELQLPQMQAPAVTGIFAWLAGLVNSAVGSLFVAVAAPLLAVFSRFGKPIVVAAVFAAAGVIFVRSLDISGGQNSDVAASLLTAGERLTELRNRSTSEAEWDTFTADTRTWLKPTIADLQTHAQRFPLQGRKWFDFERLNARTRHDLIRACNALDKELDEGPLNTGGPVAFNSLLGEALSKLEGNEFRGWNRARGPARPAGDDFDSLTVGFIAFDALVLIGGAAFWLRRKRARAA